MRKLLLVAAVLLTVGMACSLGGDSAEVESPPVELDVKPSQSPKPTLTALPPPTFTSLTTSISPTPVSQASDTELGQIKGVLIDKNSGKPASDLPRLGRDILENETRAEVREIMNIIEFEIDEKGWFLFKGIPYGQYFIFTEKHGLVTPAFIVEPGQTVDLGEIEISK